MNITVDLPDHIAAQLESISDLIGISKSGIVKLALLRALPEIHNFAIGSYFPPPLLTTSPPPNALKITKGREGEGGDCKGEGGDPPVEISEPANKPVNKPAPDNPSMDEVNALVALWNANCGSLPKVERLTAGRIQKAKVRLARRPDTAEWLKGIQNLAASEFVNSGGWCNFSWILRNDENITKALEGAYANKKKFVKPTTPRRVISPEEARLVALEREKYASGMI